MFLIDIGTLIRPGAMTDLGLTCSLVHMSFGCLCFNLVTYIIVT